MPFKEGDQSPEPEQPEEEKKEIIDISEKELLKLMTSHEFLKALKIAGQETYISGRETGFDIFAFKDKKLEFGDIKKGGLDALGGLDYTDTETIKAEREDLMNDFSNGLCEILVLLHFHPSSEEAIIPSGADLNNLIKAPLIVTCRIQKNKIIDALLVKLNQNIPVTELDSAADFYDQEISSLYSEKSSRRGGDFVESKIQDETVSKVLSGNGFDNCTIHYNYNKKQGKYTLMKKSKKEISKFGGLKIKI